MRRERSSDRAVGQEHRIHLLRSGPPSPAHPSTSTIYNEDLGLETKLRFLCDIVVRRTFVSCCYGAASRCFGGRLQAGGGLYDVVGFSKTERGSSLLGARPGAAAGLGIRQVSHQRERPLGDEESRQTPSQERKYYQLAKSCVGRLQFAIESKLKCR